MKKRKTSSNWKPVQLTGDLVAKGVEGLIGIEELHDYSLENKNRKASKNVSNGKSLNNKRKVTTKGNDSNEPKSKKKKLIKRKNVTEENDGEVDDCTDKVDNLTDLHKRKIKSKVKDSNKAKRKKKRLIKRKNISEENEGEVDDCTGKTTDLQKRKVTSKLKDSNKAKKKKKKLIKRKRVSEESEDDCADKMDDCTDNLTDLHDEMSAWNGLGIPDLILRALAEQGFKEPTVIQIRTLPPAVMGRRDILGAAETGSGKTLAFGIPILHHILEDKEWDKKNEEIIQCDKIQEENSDTENNDDVDDSNYVNGNDDGSSDDDDDDVDSNTDDIENSDDDDDNDEEKEEEELVEDFGDNVGCVQVINNISLPSQMQVMSDSKLYALILTPTRELAIQINNHLKAAAKYTGIKIAVVIGGMSIQKQERLLNQRPEIVVATPGRLWEMIENGNHHLSQVGSIRYLAIDETDRMLEKGHFQELQNLLELINVDEKIKKKRQNFVFSATLTMVHDPPKHLKLQKKKLKITPGQKLQSIMTALGITNPKVIDITSESGTARTLTEARILCTLEEKDFYLYYFLQRHPGRTLIFCNSISCVRRLAHLLTLLKCNPLPLHANMEQRQRLKNLDRFRDNPVGVLLATDVAARGLDIPNVQHVVHYQVPRTSEGYVHRSGRTARAQKQGLTLLLVEPTEAQYYTRVCQTLGRSKDLPLFPVESNPLSVAKKRVALAREVDRLELVSRRSTSETGWFRKALADMDMLVDEDDVPRQLDDDECSRNRKLVTVKKKQLDALVSKPVFVTNVSNNSLDFMSTISSPKVVNSGMYVKKKGKNRKTRFRKKNKPSNT